MRAAQHGLVSQAVAAGHPLSAAAQKTGGMEDALHSAQLSFGVYALGAKGLDVVLDVQRENGTLHVETAMRTSGALNLLMRFESKAKVAALVRDDGLQPLRYLIESDGRWSKRSLRMTWGPDGPRPSRNRPPDMFDRVIAVCAMAAGVRVPSWMMPEP